MYRLFRVPQRRGRLLLVGSGIMALVLLASVLAFFPYSGFQAHAATPPNTPGKGKRVVYEDPVTHEEDTITSDGEDGHGHHGAHVDIPAGAGLPSEHIDVVFNDGAGPSNAISPMRASFSRSRSSVEAPPQSEVAAQNQLPDVDVFDGPVRVPLSTQVESKYYHDGYATYTAPDAGIQYSIQVWDRANRHLRTLHVHETSNNRLRLNQFRNRVDEMRKVERNLSFVLGAAALVTAWLVGTLEVPGTPGSAANAKIATQERYSLLAVAAFIAGITSLYTSLTNISDLHEQLVSYFKEVLQGDGDPRELGAQPHQDRRRLSADNFAQATPGGTTTGTGTLSALPVSTPGNRVATTSQRPVNYEPYYSGYSASTGRPIGSVNAAWLIPCARFTSTGTALSIVELGAINTGFYAGTEEDASNGYRFLWGGEGGGIAYPDVSRPACNDYVNVSITTDVNNNFVNTFFADYTRGIYIDEVVRNTFTTYYAAWNDTRLGSGQVIDPLYDFTDVSWAHCNVKFTDGSIKQLDELNYTREIMEGHGQILAYPGPIYRGNAFRDYWARA